jgi:hypothetical protein
MLPTKMVDVGGCEGGAADDDENDGFVRVPLAELLLKLGSQAAAEPDKVGVRGCCCCC